MKDAHEDRATVAPVTVKRLVGTCHDCGVAPGFLHLAGCDVERCPVCGGQYISCDCDFFAEERLPWAGIWPGVEECREFGWYSKMVPGKGWVRCEKEESGATEDLNRLAVEAKWNSKLGRYVL
jgi:hypothetical protein